MSSGCSSYQIVQAIIRTAGRYHERYQASRDVRTGLYIHRNVSNDAAGPKTRGGCGGDNLSAFWWRDRDLFLREMAAHDESFAEMNRVHKEPSTRALSDWARKHGIRVLHRGPKPMIPDVEGGDGWLIDALRAAGDKATVEKLADMADVPPRKIREAAERLSQSGYRIDLAEHAVTLDRIVPDRMNLHPDLLGGKTVLLGVVSDTHLGANEQALDELHLAYDVFKSEGITDVLHPGDITTGMNIFRGQDAEVHVHTLDEIRDYAVEHYPSRNGITTRLIGGNHDLEGDAGRVGLDIAAAVASERDDIEYLGAYSAWVGMHGGAWIHLLHGRGGMSYSVSYKAQKLVDGYSPGRKPAVLIVGHWHVRGNFEARGVEVVFPGCFEWQSRFLQRLGLMPAVGFHTIELTFGDDGSLVRFLPRWYKFHEGRVVG